MQASGAEPTFWLARTKLQPPLPRADLIPRPQLVSSLRAAVLCSRLTLVSAPAGFGKSTLLGTLSWGEEALPLAWLSLDEEDDDLTRFLRAVVLALRRLCPGFGSSVLSLLGDPTNPSPNPHHVAAALVNDALEAFAEATVLVLDDLHLISNPAVHATLDSFLERMPPLLHLAIGTRHDPPLSLARLHARGQLAELRLDDIRFSLEEAAQLLSDQFAVELGADDLALLYEQTEGWPVGLRLLSDSLAKIPSQAGRSAYLRNLQREARPLFDYLAAEVLDRQAPAVRRFLLETSILADLTPDVCRAVTGRRDAASLLEDLDRRNLLVRAVEEAPATFRYHPLFAGFLQARLKQESPKRVAELHHRAGLATTNSGRAIGHYIAAERWPEAAKLIEQVGGPMLRDGLTATVAGWLQAIPEAVRASHGRLAMLEGICSFFRSDLASSRMQLERALPTLDASGDEIGAAEALTYLATCCVHQADLASADAVIRQALSRSPSAPQRVQLLMMRSLAACVRKSSEEALASFDGALAEAEAARSPEVYAAMALHFRLDMAALPGVIDRLERFLDSAVPLFGGAATLSGVAILELLTFSHLWRGRLKEAVEAGERGVAYIRRLGGHPLLGGQAAGFSVMAYLAMGDHDNASRLLDFVFELIAATPMGQLYIAAPLYAQGESRLAQGDLRGAHRTCQALWAAARDMESTEAPVLRNKLKGHLKMASGHYAEAESYLRQATALEEELPGAKLFGRTRLLLARLAYEQGRLDVALAELEPVLAECERHDTPGVILLDGAAAAPVLRLAIRRGLHTSFAERVLSLLPPSGDQVFVPVPETAEVLSPRELQVLALVATGARNRAIAKRLLIEETTVKSHVSNILRKLGVSSRTEAAARARDFGVSAGETPTKFDD